MHKNKLCYARVGLFVCKQGIGLNYLFWENVDISYLLEMEYFFKIWI